MPFLTLAYYPRKIELLIAKIQYILTAMGFTRGLNFSHVWQTCIEPNQDMPGSSLMMTSSHNHTLQGYSRNLKAEFQAKMQLGPEQ